MLIESRTTEQSGLHATLRPDRSGDIAVPGNYIRLNREQMYDLWKWLANISHEDMLFPLGQID